MSEKKQIHSPEADPQAIDDLYQQAADCLETWLHYGQAEVSPSMSDIALLNVKAKMPEFNGRTLELEYERPAREDDPTQVDTNYPLIWDREDGKNAWNVWITVRAYDAEGSLVNDIALAHSGNDFRGQSHSGVADELCLQPSQDPEEQTTPVSMLEAGNLNAHMEWAAEQLLDQHIDEDQ